MISLEKKILTPLQKLPKNVGNLGKIIGARGFKKLPTGHLPPLSLSPSFECNYLGRGWDANASAKNQKISRNFDADERIFLSWLTIDLNKDWKIGRQDQVWIR